MEEQLKMIVAGYLKTETSAIGNETVIDRSALGKSIVLHRLYASFSQQGYNVSNYNTIRTFGDLKTRLKHRNGTEKNVDNGITINTAGDKKTLIVNHA